MPRKKRYETPADMKKHVEEYFREREAREEFPTFAGMLKFLNISKRTYYRYMDADNGDETMSEEDRREYRKIFEEAELRREDYLEKKMVSEPRLANGCMNSLKQPQNGGFKDRIEGEIDARITVNIAGVGGENAFK